MDHLLFQDVESLYFMWKAIIAWRYKLTGMPINVQNLSKNEKIHVLFKMCCIPICGSGLQFLQWIIFSI